MTSFIETWHSLSFGSYCLLTPLMSPKDTKGKLIDFLRQYGAAGGVIRILYVELA